jgi:hypothetical protein
MHIQHTYVLSSYNHLTWILYMTLKFYNTLTEQGNRLNGLLGGEGNEIWLQSVT